MIVRRRKESGFALLLVFLMAASISIMLYRQLPRAAFEAQRGKEELLQDRGQQYIRAIQMYVVKWRRFPPDLDALEKTNNVRFLRRRYKDPMTGKDEWRAVHVDGAGQLTDSILQKTETKKEAVAVFVSELPTIGSTGGAGGGDVGQNVALRRRASDNNIPGANQPGGAPGFDAQPAVGNQAYAPPPPPPGTGNTQQPQQPQEQNPQPAIDPNTGQPVQNTVGQIPLGMPPPQGFPPGVPQPPQPFNSPAQQPMMPNAAYPGAPQNGIPSAFQPGRPGGNLAMPPTTGGQPGTPQDAGLAMIGRILTTPRSGMNMNVPGATGLQVGGGIAGFASTMEAPSIKIYNDRQKYNEWEFIYDMKKDKRLVGAAAAAGGVGMPPNNNPLGGPPVTNIPNPMVNPTNPQGNPNLFPQSPTFPQPGRR